jgi:hypothetical protein
MKMDKTIEQLPPHVSYKTFNNLISYLQEDMPDRVDMSYLSYVATSISTRNRLVFALDFLNLIDAETRPTNSLKLLVAARNQEEKSKRLCEIAKSSYSFLLDGSVDLQVITYSQLHEIFSSTYGLDRYGVKKYDICERCIRFFIALAQDAGMPLSPYLNKKRRRRLTSSDIEKANQFFKGVIQ